VTDTQRGNRFLRRAPRPRAVGLFLAVAVLAPACASTSESAAQSLSGCFFFERDDTARELRLPWGIRLTESALGDWPAMRDREDVRVATTLNETRETDTPFGYWIPQGDSVEVGYPGGGGMVLELEVTETHLVGTARPVGDVLTPGTEPGARPARPVRLLHARCPGG
jgi:hypothetical protein